MTIARSGRTVLVVLVLVALGFLLGAAKPVPPEADLGPLLVTSSLGALSAVLFVVDPKSGTVASYEATPGEDGGLRLLGARRIDYDLRLTKYRDQSEFSYAELREQYEAGKGGEDDRRD